jgi:hypothetical protein
MAKYCKSGNLNPINHLLKINHLHIMDLAKALNVTYKTMLGYIDNPTMMDLRQISVISGFFGIKVEVLVYLLIRNKTQIRPKDKKDKWYIEDVVNEGDKIFSSIPRENFGDMGQKP